MANRARESRPDRGFTLVELLVAMAVGVILMAGVYQFFIAQQRSYSTQDAVNRVQQNARMAETLIAKAIQLTGSYLPDPLNAATVSMRDQSILAATDRYLVLQYDDPLNTANLHVVAADEVVAFVISKTAPVAGTAGGTEAIDVPVHFDKNGDGTLTDPADAHNFQVSLDLGSPPYTLYRVTPTAAGGIVAEAIAPNVDNFVLRYYDRNGQPLVLGATGAEALATTPLTADERWAVRSIEVELVLRTATEDPNLAASLWADFTPGSAVTRDASGAIDTGFAGLTDRYRRRKFVSRITPRSMAIGSCGRLELAASDPAPNCPDNTTVTATVLDQYGAPVSGATVLFSATDGTLSAASGTTGAAGQTSVDLDYTELSKQIMVSAQTEVACTRGGSTAPTTLINSFMISFQPGPWDYVKLSDQVGTSINTCDDSAFTFTAKSYDQCDNEVPPEPGLFFEAPLTTGTGTGQITGDTPTPAHPWGTQAEMTTTGQVFSVAAPTTGPLGSAASYHMDVQATAGSTLPPNVTGQMLLSGIGSDLLPWPPQTISYSPVNMVGATHQDCPSADTSDTFRVLDCLTNPIHTLHSGYQVEAQLAPDGSVVAAEDHGTLFSADAGVAAGSGAISVTLTDSTIGGTSGVFDIGYHPPKCTLGPPSGSTVTPTVTLELTDGTSALDTESGALTLEACEDCVVQFLAVPTACEQEVPVLISGCQFNTGDTVELELTSTGAGSGEFADATTGATYGSTYTHTFAAGQNDFTINLLIQNQAGGDDYTVTAYYPSKTNARWSCTATTTVSTDCNNLKVFSLFESCDPSLTCPSGSTFYAASAGGCNLCVTDLTAAPADNCLANVVELYFEVDDCQSVLKNLPNAIEVWTEANGVAYDQEYIDLSESSSNPGLFQAKAVASGSSKFGGLPMGPSGNRNTNDGFLAYPTGKDIRLVARYADPVDTTDTCEEDVEFVAPIPVCFPNAITSGGGGTWNGNFDIHWGDVVIIGNVDLPVQSIKKDVTSSLTGNKEDRFFDIYVGKASPGDTGSGNFLRSGADVCEQVTDTLDRPLIPGGTAASYASPGWMYGNYFCNVSNEKILTMTRALPYETLKALAKTRGVYWYTLATGNIVNPNPGAHVTQTIPVTGVSLETVLNLIPSGGGANGYHNAEFLFIDTYDATNLDTYTDTDINNMCVDDPVSGTSCATLPTNKKLPVHTISGGIYTSGIIYIAGTLDWGGSGGGMDLNGSGLPLAKTPPARELHYQDNVDLGVQPLPAWNPTEDDLPIRPNPALSAAEIALSNVHVNGALYLDGALDGGGNIKVYGAITAERGFKGSGSPEIWYNYNLNVSGDSLSLCVTCCEIQLSPASATLFPGGTATLTATAAAGTPYWWSGNPAVASVTQSGVVTAHAIGRATISAVDNNNCVASSEIYVLDSCDVFKDPMNISPPTPFVIAPGDIQSFSALFVPTGSTVSWVSSNTSVATITPDGQATGVCPGTTVITAQDSSGSCPTGPEGHLTVAASSCALGLSSAGITLAPGATAPLSALNGICDVTWSSSNPAIASISPASGTATTITGVGNGIATISATDQAGCTASVSVGVGCGAITVGHAPADAELIPGMSYTLTPAGGTAPYTWAIASGPGTISGNLLTPSGAGTLVVDVTDATGCTKSMAYPVACLPPTLATDFPADGSSYGIATTNGRYIPWQATPNDHNGADTLDEIFNVRFEMFNSAGVSVYNNTEFSSLYCGFSGTAACTLGIANFPNDTYTFTATATTTDAHPCGTTTVSDSVSVTICNIYMVAATGGVVTSPLRLMKGVTFDLNPANAVGVVNWSSSDAGIFTVDPGGTITTKNVPSDQSATLTLTDQTGCTNSITVEVYKTALP